MKALRLVLILSFPLLSVQCFGQQNGILFLTAGKLDSLAFPVGIEQSYFEHAHKESLSNANWKYHAGDDLQWKEPAFDDHDWKLLKPDFNPDSIQKGEWQGIGWFRLKIIIDSTLQNRPLALVLTHFGASEVYFDGVLLNQYGTPSSDPKRENTYRPLNLQPIILPLSARHEYLLAVRYSFHDVQKIMDKHKKGFLFNFDKHYAGFKVHFAQTRHSIDLFGESLKSNLLYVTITVTALFLMGCFHISLYLFYAKDHSNFYLAILNFTVACFIFTQWLPSFTHLGLRSATFNDLIGGVSYNLWIPVLMLAFYSVFYKKPPWYVWLYFIGISLLIIDWVRSSTNIYDILHDWLMYLAWVDMLRIFIRSVIKREKNIWIVGIGVLLSQTAWILYLSPISMFRSFDNISVYMIPLAVPLSLLIFNALRTAKTTINLENQMSEVLRLSELSYKQEKEKQNILTAQKETLELQVKERTNELILSLESLKSTQAQLIHAEKMASMGELTAGIAHEIQNPINFINNFSEINRELITDLKSEFAKDSNMESITILKHIEGNEEKISEHGQRADAIVKSMLQHSRSSSGQKELVDVNALADEYLTLAYHGMRAKDKSFSATIKSDLDPKAGKISLIPQEISRVLMNLYNNAFYEVSEKKKIMKGDYEPTVIVTTTKADNKILISIKDNGRGIPGKIRTKIFQPFFTTKPSGKGTGLGLSLSYDIVKVHGGQLTFESEEGEYSVFTLQLPA